MDPFDTENSLSVKTRKALEESKRLKLSGDNNAAVTVLLAQIDTESREGVCVLLCNILQLHRESGEYEKCLDIAQRLCHADRIRVGKQFSVFIADDLAVIGELHQLLNQNEEAAKTFEEAIRVGVPAWEGDYMPSITATELNTQAKNNLIRRCFDGAFDSFRKAGGEIAAELFISRQLEIATMQHKFDNKISIFKQCRRLVQLTNHPGKMAEIEAFESQLLEDADRQIASAGKSSGQGVSSDSYAAINAFQARSNILLALERIEDANEDVSVADMVKQELDKKCHSSIESILNAITSNLSRPALPEGFSCQTNLPASGANVYLDDSQRIFMIEMKNGEKIEISYEGDFKTAKSIILRDEIGVEKSLIELETPDKGTYQIQDIEERLLGYAQLVSICENGDITYRTVRRLGFGAFEQSGETTWSASGCEIHKNSSGLISDVITANGAFYHCSYAEPDNPSLEQVTMFEPVGRVTQITRERDDLNSVFKALGFANADSEDSSSSPFTGASSASMNPSYVVEVWVGYHSGEPTVNKSTAALAAAETLQTHVDNVHVNSNGALSFGLIQKTTINPDGTLTVSTPSGTQTVPTGPPATRTRRRNSEIEVTGEIASIEIGIWKLQRDLQRKWQNITAPQNELRQVQKEIEQSFQKYLKALFENDGNENEQNATEFQDKVLMKLEPSKGTRLVDLAQKLGGQAKLVHTLRPNVKSTDFSLFI